MRGCHGGLAAQPRLPVVGHEAQRKIWSPFHWGGLHAAVCGFLLDKFNGLGGAALCPLVLNEKQVHQFQDAILAAVAAQILGLDQTKKLQQPHLHHHCIAMIQIMDDTWLLTH